MTKTAVVVYTGADACPVCLGWKRVDDGDDPCSWKYWAELPEQSAIAVRMGLVRPVVCPRCGGTGQEGEVHEEDRDTGQPSTYLATDWLTSCDNCASQEVGGHYCLLHGQQMRDMDLLTCSDWEVKK
jgi:hypothetical protein